MGDALALPARLEGPEPCRVGRPVVALVDRGRRALEDVELPGPLAEMRDALHRGRAGADDADGLVGEPGQPARRVAAGIVEIPAGGVEAVPLKALDPRNTRQLRPAEQAD